MRFPCQKDRRYQSQMYLLSRSHHNAISWAAVLKNSFSFFSFFFLFFWPVMTGSANVGFELKRARDFMDHIFITLEHREGEWARVLRQQHLFRCTSGVLKWDLMSFVQQHEDNGVQGSTRQWLVQYWLYADFCKKVRLQESNVQTFTSFLLRWFLSIKHDTGYNLSTSELLAPSSCVKTFISMKRRSVMLQFIQWNVNFTFNSPLVRRGHLHEPGMHFSWLWWITKDPQKPHAQAWGENNNPAKKGTSLGLLNGNSSVETILGCKVSTVIFLYFLLFLITAFILGLLACVHFQSIPYG